MSVDGRELNQVWEKEPDSFYRLKIKSFPIYISSSKLRIISPIITARKPANFYKQNSKTLMMDRGNLYQ